MKDQYINSFIKNCLSFIIIIVLAYYSVNCPETFLFECAAPMPSAVPIATDGWDAAAAPPVAVPPPVVEGVPPPAGWE